MFKSGLHGKEDTALVKEMKNEAKLSNYEQEMVTFFSSCFFLIWLIYHLISRIDRTIRVFCHSDSFEFNVPEIKIFLVRKKENQLKLRNLTLQRLALS